VPRQRLGRDPGVLGQRPDRGVTGAGHQHGRAGAVLGVVRERTLPELVQRRAAWFAAQWGNRAPSTWNVSLDDIRSAAAHWRQQGWITADPSRMLKRRKARPDRARVCPTALHITPPCNDDRSILADAALSGTISGSARSNTGLAIGLRFEQSLMVEVRGSVLSPQTTYWVAASTDTSEPINRTEDVQFIDGAPYRYEHTGPCGARLLDLA
jgi:hypothetical protein